MVIPLVNKHITAYHYTPDSDNSDKEGYILDIGLQNISCNIQPTSPDIAQLYEGAYGKTHTIYTTASGILITDKVTVSGSNDTYIIRGKQFFDYYPSKHGEYIAELIQS